MKHLLIMMFSVVLFLGLGKTSLSQTTIIQDNLQGSTVGTQVGGYFTSEGYVPGAGENHILYDIPVQIENGYIEVQVKGFNFNDFPEVTPENPSYETSFMVIYDGRGIPEPIGYFFDYRNNYFRWDVTYRSDKYDSPGTGNRWKGKIHIAEDSPARLNSTYAVYPEVPEHTADWGIEPNGIYSYWDPNQWYTIQVIWDNNTKVYSFYRDGVLMWASNLDAGTPITDNSPYPLYSPWPWLPIDFKIHLGSGPGRYSSKMPNMVYRNFKVVSTGGISTSAPVIVSSPITSAAVGELYSYDVNASGNPTPTYSLTESPSGMTINSSTGLIEWTPGSTGSYNVTVVASNGINPDDSQSFTINVQSSSTFAPIITSTPITSATVGQLYTYDVETDANPNPTYSLSVFPSEMTINPSSGLIQWTPSATGDFSVTVVASNGINPDDSQSFTINVQSSSTFAPIITSTPITSATVGQLYTYDVETDANPNPTYSLSVFPSGMTINSSSGLIQWTPSATGDFSVTVVASNGINPDDSQSFTITVVESQSNGCPTNLISYWKLDEASGSTYTDYVGSNNATSSDVPTPGAGRVNGAQIFNGSSNGLEAPGSSIYDFGVGTSFTFEAWIKHVSGSYSGEEIVLERKSSSGALAINLKFNSNALSFSVRNTVSELFDVTGTSNLFDNNWHHIVGVRDAATNQLRIYVDGSLEGSVSANYTGGFVSTITPISIGWRSSTNGGFFNGAIDEVAVYNSALDAPSINQHYLDGLNNKGYCIEIQPINAPSSLTAVQNLSDSTDVDVSWTDNSDNESGFVIERKTGDSLSVEPFSVIDTVGADVTSYVDTTVADTTTYTYRVFAFNNETISDYSNLAQVVTPVPVELTTFSASVVNGEVLLEWTTATELNNSGFIIQRSKANEPFIDIAFVKGHGTTTYKSFYNYYDKSVSSGSYSYRLKQLDLNGSVTFSETITINIDMLSSFVLEQNYPNPFNPSTQIRFSIPQVSNVKLIITDALGKVINVLVDGKLNAGNYNLDFDSNGLSSGIYFCTLITDTYKQSRKMVLMK